MTRSVFFLLLGFLLASCTTTRWVVTEEHAVDEGAEPRVVTDQTLFLIDQEPVPDDPVLSLQLYRIIEKEYPERVKVERTVQRYRPKWEFVALGLAGAGISFVAANTGLIFSSVSTSQKLGLNIAGGLLSILSVTNLEPTGDPIYTGETMMLRRSGAEVRVDSLRLRDQDRFPTTDVAIHYEDDLIAEQDDITLEEGVLDLNLASLADDIGRRAVRESEITILITYNGKEFKHRVPVTSFLKPHLNITRPVITLRSEPESGDQYVVAEVGMGSFLEIADEQENWFRILFEGEEVYVERDAGDVEWISTAESGPALIFEFAEVPFGEIDVENALPVIKAHNPDDRALILTNGLSNDLGSLPYLERDHQLFKYYMTTSLQMDDDQVSAIQKAGLVSAIESKPDMEGRGSLHVYLSGFADVTNRDDENEIELLSVMEGEEYRVPLRSLFESIRKLNPEALYLYVDLDYLRPVNQFGNGFIRNGTESQLQALANVILRELPNSVIIFSNRPGQRSGIYTGIIDGNMRHSIFNYYWADAIKRRNVQITDLINHLERNVDYTSRRLHDRPQEIQVYGNLTLNLTR
jgi:hypothetical protein